eukprot:s1890_g3.t1
MLQPVPAAAAASETVRPSRAERLKTVFEAPSQDNLDKDSPRTNAACSKLRGAASDLIAWSVQPYNVDVELPDSDDEDNIKNGEADKEPVAKLTMREKLRKLVTSNGFEAMSCTLISINLIFLGVQADCQKGCSSFTVAMIGTLDESFTALFLVEWCLCVAAHGTSYFSTASNWLDTFIVWVVGVFLLWIAPLVFGAEGLAAFQAIRAIRGMRSLRSFRVLRHFQSFRMLLTGFLGTIFTLAACILMIFLTDLTFGIISVDIIGRDSRWGTAPEGTAAWYFQNGLIQASLTMSRFIFSDNAVSLIEELQETQPFIWIYCFAFMAIAAYVILNLVTATICDKAQAIVNENEAERLFEMRMEEKRNMKDLKHIFEVLDEDGSGLVTTEEFDAAFEIQRCRDKFFLLGFEEEEMKQLFRVLDDDGQGELSVSEFLKGMAQVQGDADSKAMLVASKTMEKVKVAYEKVMGAKGGTASMELRQTIRAEPTLDEQLTSLESYAMARLDRIDELLRSFHAKADSFERKLRTIESLPPPPASSSPDGKAKSGDAEPADDETMMGTDDL